MGKRNCLIGTCCLLWLFSVLCSPALAVDEMATDKGGKKYPHPHTVHMSVMELNLPEFIMDDVSDWPKLVQDLKAAPPELPLSVEVKMMLAGLRPTELSNSDRQVLVRELNKILAVWSEAKGGKERTPGELKWLARDRVVSLLPSLKPKKSGAQLGKITCGTCHESQVRLAREYMERQNLAVFDEKTVLDCFSKAIAGEKGFGECEAMSETLKNTRIEPYGPLRNFIQRPLGEKEISFFVAIHPEAPYTFKPLLKKLVCLECHGAQRKVKVEKIRGHDGKEKDMPIFYGLGAGSHKK